MIIDRVDANGTETPNSTEIISFAGTSGSTVTTLVRGLAGTTDQEHSVGAIVEFGPDVIWAQALIDSMLNLVDTAGALDTTKVVDLTTAQTLSKKTLKSSISEVVTTAGGHTVFTLTPSVAIASYATGQEFTILMNASNTGASTINVSGLGAKSLTKGGATALSASDLLIDAEYKIIYDGTQFQVIGISGSSATVATQAEVATGTDNTKMVTPLAATGIDTRTATFTNKTLTDPTNNITAKSLKSATTTVDVSAATAPSSGQVLTATASTTATWQTPAAAAISSKVISATRDLTAASGDVSYTGVGFVPTSLTVSADLPTKKSSSLGFADSAKNGAGHYLTDVPQSGPISDVNTNAIIFCQSAVNNFQHAQVKTYDSDGFTLTWSKINSPTGTATLRFICYR